MKIPDELPRSPRQAYIQGRKDERKEALDQLRDEIKMRITEEIIGKENCEEWHE